MSTRSIYPAAKRALDVAVSAAGLAVLAPFLVAVGVLVRLSSPGPALFRHERVGLEGRHFVLLKFRTMTAGRSGGPEVTAAGDQSVTPLGRLLRRYKIDELPQLVNVLRGEMSLVGPRPEVKKYVEAFAADYRRILEVRPGLTDFAAIAYRDEESILAASADPERAYVQDVLPAKIRLYFKYMEERSMKTDLVLLAKTIAALAR